MTTPAVYSWEATDEQVAARYGVPLDLIARFDLNTSPTPPDLATRVLAAGRFASPLSEYPPSDYRRLIDAAAARYGVGRDELLVGAGADEILDLVAKAFLPPSGAAVLPTPTYAMYRVVTEQRGARAIEVPRLGQADGWGLDLPAVLAAARAAQVVWLCSPNNPTGLPEPPGTVDTLLMDLAADAEADGRPAPIVVLDEAYAEFVGASLLGLRRDYPRLVVVRTASKAYCASGSPSPGRRRSRQSRHTVRLDRCPRCPSRSSRRRSRTTRCSRQTSRVSNGNAIDSPPGCAQPAGTSVHRSRTSCLPASDRATARSTSPRASSGAGSCLAHSGRAIRSPITCGSQSAIPMRTTG